MRSFLFTILFLPFSLCAQERPGPDNTGPLVPEPELVEYTGSRTIRTPGTVIEGVLINGTINIQADNVTIRNFVIRTGGVYGINIRSGENHLFEDGLITGPRSSAILGSDFTARRLEITHLGGDGFKPRRNFTIENNWVHRLGYIDGSHADGVQMVGSNEGNGIIRYNFFDMVNNQQIPSEGRSYSNSQCIIIQTNNGSIDNVLIQGNWFDGAGFQVLINERNGNGAPTNITITENIFGLVGLPHAQFGPLSLRGGDYNEFNNQFSVDLSSSSGDPRPPAAPVPSITGVNNGQDLSVGSNLSIAVTTVNDADVESIDLFLNDSLISRDNASPYQWPLEQALQNLSAGSYILRASVNTRSGEVLGSTINFTVSGNPSATGNVAYIHGDISEAGFTPASSATTGATTPYDQMLLTDTGGTGLSTFRDLVQEQGYSIDQYYDQVTELNANFLSDKDVIVFGLHQKRWSTAERDALDLWLRDGGGMLIYSDSASGGFHRIVGAQNSVGQSISNNLISRYGIEIMVDQANGAPSIDALDTASIVGLRGLTLKAEGVSPIAFDPNNNDVEVLIPYTGPIRTNAGLTISNPEYAALALRPVGDGHVMALFDRQPIWNDGNGANIEDEDNRLIFSTIIDFLAERPNATSPVNVEPSVEISTNGANFSPNDTVTITATASDSDGTITRVDFLVDGDLIASSTSAPYTTSFTAGNLGSYTIAARAIDNAGASNTNSVQIVVNANNPNSPLREPDVPTGALLDGVSYDYFTFANPRDFTSVTDLVGQPANSGVLNEGPSLAPAAADNNLSDYGLIFKGYINIPEDGVYTFFTTTDDGSDFFIGNERIVDNDGRHGAVEESGEIGLKTGLHAFTFRYFQRGGRAIFNYTWQGPDFSRERIPSAVWRRDSEAVITNVAPTIRLTRPLVTDEFTVDDTVEITAQANDADGDISEVRFIVDGNLLGSPLAVEPYSTSFIATGAGSYVIEVIAVDNDGSSVSDQVIINVDRADSDQDLIPDDDDNCVDTPNPDQRNTDGDRFGDACDSDIDDDGVNNENDNCPSVANFDQEDQDPDSPQGDACEPDDSPLCLPIKASNNKLVMVCL